MSELTIMKKESMKIAFDVFEKINDALKGFGIVGGGIAASLADWILGGIFMSVLFSNYGGKQASVLGWVFSMGLWGIQLLLWQIIFSGTIGRISKTGNKTASYVTVFLFIVVAKICDDIIDIGAVWWMLKDNPVQFVLSTPIYKGLLGVVFALTWVLTGFAEVFVSASIFLLRSGKVDGENNRFQPRQENRGGKDLQNFFRQHQNQQGGQSQNQGKHGQNQSKHKHEHQKHQAAPFPLFIKDDE